LLFSSSYLCFNVPLPLLDSKSPLFTIERSALNFFFDCFPIVVVVVVAIVVADVVVVARNLRSDCDPDGVSSVSNVVS
jgi:hypothetical protein